jgi:hypothetical protein
MATLFSIGDSFLATPEWLKEDGTVGKIDGPPKWENPNPDLYEMTESEDHLTATGKILKAGSGQIIARGDPDMTPGPGNRDIVLIGELEVLDAEVTTGRMNLTKQEGPAPTPTATATAASRGRR